MWCGATSREAAPLRLPGRLACVRRRVPGLPGRRTAPHPDVAAEFAARMAFVREAIDAEPRPETPDPVIDTQFRYAKLRAATASLLPRAATCTPPAANPTMRPSGPTTRPNTSTPSSPFWAMGGQCLGAQFVPHFARFMNPAYEPLPSPVIAEGDDIWNGAGDRWRRRDDRLRGGTLRPCAL